MQKNKCELLRKKQKCTIYENVTAMAKSSLNLDGCNKATNLMWNPATCTPLRSTVEQANVWNGEWNHQLGYVPMWEEKRKECAYVNKKDKVRHVLILLITRVSVKLKELTSKTNHFSISFNGLHLIRYTKWNSHCANVCMYLQTWRQKNGETCNS